MSGIKLITKEILNATQGQFVLSENPNSIITEVITDSRLLGGKAFETMFVAIKTKHNDGHNYIGELLKKGVYNFIITDKEQTLEIIEKYRIDNLLFFNDYCNIILVDDALEALQNIALLHRKKIKYPIIGITGSNGKTVVKEWLWQLLSHKMRISRSPKSYNSQIGVPLSVFKLKTNSNLGILEAGISEPQEMKKLQRVIKPNYGIITNIGTAHLKNFKNKQQLLEEKLQLFKDSDKIIYCGDFEFIDTTIRAMYPDRKLFCWYKKDVQKWLNENMLNHNFEDEASIENIGHCLMLITVLGYDINDFKQYISHLTPIEMRLEVKNGINNCLIVNDSYSLDINSFVIAIDTLMKQSRYDKKTAIISDFQLDDDATEIKMIAEILNQKPIDKVYLIGKRLKEYKELFQNKKIKIFDKTEDFISEYKISDFYNEAILIKGARKFQFERISNLLQMQEHETVLEINVEALTHNLNKFRKKLEPSTKMLVMVKAFSYGIGSIEMANIMQENYIDYMAVAFVDEGIELRNAGIRSNIIVMNPETHALNAMIKFKLEPEIYSLKRLIQFCEILNVHKNDKPYPIHIKIDTGMHRLGFNKAELPKLLEILKANKNLVRVESVFSHLACADDEGKDKFTLNQIRLFNEIVEDIEKSIGYMPIRHILNSWGIARFPEYQMDMVRLGIGLYGTEPELIDLLNLDNALRLRTVVSQINEIHKGEGIGYGQTWIAERDSQIAILPIGYADGFSLALSNSYYEVYINGYKAAIVGRVCMDMCFVDVTNIDVNEGDEVEIFGEHASIGELAKSANTITYEIISTLSQRIKRVYYH